MIKLLIIADDFTGGLDTGVQFASRGIPTCVITKPDADYQAEAADCEVLVVVAETRHLPPAQAHGIVFAAARKGVVLGIPHIYKKTDSALRGNIGAELSAVLEASGAELLPFLPALPAMNRVTRQGVHYIDGQPVAESVFGRDPFEPVRESDVCRLIALQTDTPAVRASQTDLRDANGIAVLDAETNEDLLRAGRALAGLPEWRISAGCAGFAAMLPELLHLGRNQAPCLPKLDPGLFVLCGSVNPITQRQLAWGEEHGFTRVHIAPGEKLDPGLYATPEGQAILEGWKKRMAECPRMILDANDEDCSNKATADEAARRGLTIEQVRQRISESLGIILSELADTPAKRTMLITGGDTLMKSMNRMNVYRMMPLIEVFPGVVLSRVALGSQSRFVITKSGGFGEETLLLNLKQLISGQSHD